MEISYLIRNHLLSLYKGLCDRINWVVNWKYTSEILEYVYDVYVCMWKMLEGMGSTDNADTATMKKYWIWKVRTEEFTGDFKEKATIIYRNGESIDEK